MGNQVDNRVVQLEMQNDSFEKGANQSIKTLDKLDNALNLKNGKRSFSEVEAAAEKCNFSPLLGAADKVIGKFSALEIAGITALSNITNRAVNAGINLAKSLSVDQITSGFSKYQQKTANVQTLVNSTGKSIDEINQYLDRLMWFSDETSYGFTDMTQALATMVNAGGDIDKIVPMIEGMANATAFAGKGAAEFNRVIYNLNQSYSQGFLTYMDWKSVQMAGANSKQLVETLIRAGEEAGTIKKGEVTIDNFTSTLSKRWANREVMEKAFGYFDEMTQKAYEMIGTVDEQGNKIENATQAYDILAKKYDGVSINAAKAAQEAKSLNEAIDSTKDAVSSGWMRTFEIIIGDYEQAKELWSSVADGLWTIFAGGFEARNTMLQEAFQTEPVEDYAKSLEKAGIKFDEFRHKMAKAYADKVGMPEWMTFTDFEATISKATNFSELLKESWVNSSLLEQTIGQFTPKISEAATETKELSLNVKDIINDVKAGKYGKTLAEQQQNLIAAGIDGSSLGKDWLSKWRTAVTNNNKKALQEINKSLSKTVTTTVESTEALEGQAEAFDELKQKAKDFDNSYYASNSGRTIMLAGIANVLKAIGDRLGTVKDAWDEAFPMITAERLKGMLITFHRFSETLKMSEAEGHLIAAVSNRVFANLSKIKDILGSIGSVAMSAIKLGGRFGDWFIHLKPVQEALGRIKDYLKFFDNNFGGGLKRINNSLRGLKSYIDQIVKGDFDKLVEKFKKLGRYMAPFVNAWNEIKTVSTPVITAIGTFLTKVWNEFATAAMPVITSIKSFFMGIGGWIYTNAVNPFGKFISSVANSEKPIETLINGVKAFGKNTYDAIKMFGLFALDSVYEKLPDKVKKLGTLFQPVISLFSKVSSSIKSFFMDIGGWINTNAIAPFAEFIKSVVNSEKPIDTLIYGIRTFNSYMYHTIKSFNRASSKKLAKFFSPLISGWKKLKLASAPVIAGISQFFVNLGTWINLKAIQPFAEFVSSVIHSEKPIQTLIDGIKQFGSNAFASIKKVIDAVKNFKFSDAISKLSDKFPAVATAIDKVSEAFKKLTTNADGTKKSLDFSKVISAITFAGLIGAVAELAHALTTIQKAADTIKTTFANINKVVTRKFTNRFEKNVYAVAYAVVAFAASIYVLSKIPEEKLKAAVGSILALMVALGVLSAVMTLVAKRLSNKNIKALNGLAKPMLALSTSLLILSLAAKKMSSAFDGLTGFEETMTRVVGILALVGGLGLELIGFATLMMLMKGKIAASAIVLVVIATAILMMASAINSIADVKLSDDAKLILDRIIMVGAIVAAIASFGNPANVKGFSTFTNIIVSLAALAAAMYFGMLALQKMKEFKYEDVINSLDKVAIILGIVIGLGFILQLLSKSIQPITKAIARLSIAVFALIGAMYLISLLVGKLSAMADTGNIDAGVRAMTSIALAVAMLMAVMGASLKISGNSAKGAIKMATSLLIVVVAMASMVAVLKVIDVMFSGMTARSIAKIAHIFGGIVVVIAALALAIGYAGKLGEGKGIGVLIAALAGIVVLTAVLIVLTNFNFMQLLPGLIAIIVVAAAIGGVMLAVGKAVAAANKNGKGASGLLAAAFVLISIGAALAIVASQPWLNIVLAGAAMVAALWFVSAAIRYLGETKINWQSLGAIAAAIAVLLTIAFAIKTVVPALIAITSVPWQSLLVNTLILVGAIGILVAGFMLLSTFVGTVPPAIAVLAVVAVTLVAIGVLFVAFAASMAILANVNYGAIATGLLLCIDPMSQIGTIAIGLILGAVGVALFAGAIALLGLAGKYSAAGITAFGIALEYLLGILSAVGNAVQNSNGSIIGALANLRGELATSAESVEKDASRMKTALSNINSADVIDAEGLFGDAKSAVSQMADGIDQNSGEIKNAAVGAITSAGEAATQEAGVQGKTAGEAFAANYYAAKEAGYQNMLIGQDGVGFTRMDPNMGMTNAPAKQEAQAAPKTSPTEMVKSWLGNMGTDLANYDFSSMASSFGGNLMSSIGTYLSGTGINDFMTQLTGTFSEGDFTGVTDTIANVFGIDLTNSLSNQESTDAMKDAGEELMDKATEGAKKVDASPAGTEWANEVGSGMSGQKGALESIARSLANAAMAAFKANWHPESLMSMASYASYDDDVAVYSDDYDVEPMSITPVLDMSEVDAAVDDFGSVYTPTIRPTLDMSGADPAYANVSAVSARNTQKESGYEVETTRGTEQPSSVNFVQNNYSPKNLSRVDIYRQTRNQLDMFEGMIKKK
jgi:hypothetical protein|nr:MAG TPA: tail tape measure [Caudoviricetes sp.]